MKKPDFKFWPWLLLVGVLTIGAAATGLYRYPEWNSGSTGAGGLWSRVNAAPDTTGMWTQTPTLSTMTVTNFVIQAGENIFTWFAEADGGVVFSNSANGLLLRYNSPVGLFETPKPWAFQVGFFARDAGFTNQVTANQYLTPYSTSDFIPTNNALSNLTINFITGPGKRDLYITNNVTLTNIVPPGLGTNGSITLRITPQLIPRGLLLPTLGGNQFGVKIHTNANNPVWTTLTNGASYRLVMEAWGTNIDVAISEWK